ncbi:hypothetical protein [Muribaculum intestinale]|jgi:hypothetical protein|uniref:hypothetical protein n=1 Tax=Muribaculum intestinale TaxID=1796646 RepID=UPI00242DFD7C|nr:hypothetical protein [Muribaculum intestinale]
MKLTGSKSFLLSIALIMSFVGALGAGVMLGTGLDWWLFAVFAAMAIFGSVWASKILKPVPDVGIIIKYNFPKDAGYYQKGKQKTTPVNDNDILYHLKMFLPFIQIGMFVFAAALFSGDSNDVPQRVESISFDGGKAELVIFDQGAFGSYADLRIYNSEAEHIESISIRTEDATPTIDSIKGKDVYVSYRKFPGSDSILPYDRVMLGESLIEHDNLKFNYHFRNIK